MSTSKRNTKIAKRLARGEPAAAVAERYGLTSRSVRRLSPTPGKAGRPSTGALTHNTAAGRVLLAHVVERLPELRELTAEDDPIAVIDAMIEMAKREKRSGQ